MDWPHLSHQQDDLAALCSPRAVYPAEYHIQNELYGLHRLLQEYAGLPTDRPLPWAMEHAIHFDAAEPYAADAASRLPLHLAITPAQADLLRSHGAAEVHAIGAAYFYMRHLADRRCPRTPDRPRRGTLVFPDKSTTHQDTDYDRERFARELAALPEEFQPVVVSIFWRDYERGTHLPFARAGLRLVTSGHPYDPLFLFRQYELCRQFRYACANDLSTSFCLSVLSGCHFFHWPTGPLRMTREGVCRDYAEEPTLHLAGKQACIAAAPFPPIDNRAEQVRLAERYAGAASVRPPQLFRALAKQGDRLLRKQPRTTLAFQPTVPRDALAGWRTWGVDADGWAQKRGGFALAGHPATLEIEIPHEVIPTGSACWWFRRGWWRRRIEIRPGSTRLEIPATSGEFEWWADAAIPLQGESRQRSFRIVALTPQVHPARRNWWRWVG